jgi:hypothetical protein
MFKNSFLIKTLAVCAGLVGMAQATYVAPGGVDPVIGTNLTAPTGNQILETLHNTPQWQILGTKWGVDDGLKWSINGGAFAAVDESFTLTAGDKVQFEFDMYKQLWGTHTFDAIRVWNGTNTIKLYQDADRTVEDYTWDFNKDDPSMSGTQSYYRDYNKYDYDNYGSSANQSVKEANWARYYADVTEDFFSDIMTVTDDFSITARVVCSRDLSGGAYNKVPTPAQWAEFTLSKEYTQGEAEEYCFNVETRDVPEPSTISLLGFGILGLMLVRRKKKQ